MLESDITNLKFVCNIDILSAFWRGDALTKLTVDTFTY
jgi:hypothetical protein